MRRSDRATRLHHGLNRLVNAGRSLYEVKAVLGHTQLKTTQRYAHLSQATLLEAVEVVVEAAGLTVETTMVE